MPVHVCVRAKLQGGSAQRGKCVQFGGTFRGVCAKKKKKRGRSQPPARPNIGELGRREDFRECAGFSPGNPP